MNSLTQRILTATIAGLTLFTLGCASMYDEGGRTTEDDLQEDIQLRLDQDALVYAGTVRVTVSRGVVTLHGSVPNEHARIRAVSIAESRPGVTEVVDALYRR